MWYTAQLLLMQSVSCIADDDDEESSNPRQGMPAFLDLEVYHEDVGR